MKKILFLIIFFSSCMLIAYSEERQNRLTRIFIEKYLSSKRIIIKKSLGIEAPEYILKIDTILSSGILCKVYDVVTTADTIPDEEIVFVARVFITDVPNKKMLVDDQELPTNIIYCKHKYYIKVKERLYSYRCNKCKSGFFSLKNPPEVMRGWKLYRTGVVQIGGCTVAKFSMKNPAKTENKKKTETNNVSKTPQTPQN